MVDDPCFLPATEIAARIRRGDLSPVDAVEAYLDRIADHDDEIRAFVTVIEDEARERAREAERAVAGNEDLGPLHGVPVAIKDLFAYKAGTPHTFGSRVFEDHVPDRSAPVVERLEAAGAIVLGKTNTPEFGNRPTTDNDLVGTTVNPFDGRKTAGGTSGGSAAAVASGMAALAQGSDAGGSIRIPAACCGVVGVKPSFGRVPNGSRPNAFAEHTPFVQHGPLARTVADAGLVLDAVAGPHPDDPFTHPDEGVSYADAARRGIDDLEIAYSEDLGLFRIEDGVRETVEETVADLRGSCAAVREVTPEYDHTGAAIRDAWRTYFQILLADVAMGIGTDHGIDLLEAHRETIDPLFVKIVEAGRGHSAMDVKRADVVRTDVYDTIQEILTEYDALVTPTLAVTPFDADRYGPAAIAGASVDPFIDWILSWVFNMTDHPAASVPAGQSDGLPVGLQVVGPRLADETVLSVAGTVERVRPWKSTYPP